MIFLLKSKFPDSKCNFSGREPLFNIIGRYVIVYFLLSSPTANEIRSVARAQTFSISAAWLPFLLHAMVLCPCHMQLLLTLSIYSCVSVEALDMENALESTKIDTTTCNNNLITQSS